MAIAQLTPMVAGLSVCIVADIVCGFVSVKSYPGYRVPAELRPSAPIKSIPDFRR